MSAPSVVAYWCLRCETSHYVGSPDDQCTACGYEKEAR